MGRLRQVVATVTTVAVVGLSAACGGDNPAPSTAQSASPASPSSSASTEPSAPDIPRAATQPGRRGAAAFVRHWVDVLNYAGQTGDTRGLRRISTTDCVRCAALWEGIDQVYAADGEITGGGWQVLSTKEYGPTQGRVFVDATIRSQEQTLTPSEGATPTEFPGVEKRLRAFVLRPIADGWKVAELDPTA